MTGNVVTIRSTDDKQTIVDFLTGSNSPVGMVCTSKPEPVVFTNLPTDLIAVTLSRYQWQTIQEFLQQIVRRSWDAARQKQGRFFLLKDILNDGLLAAGAAEVIRKNSAEVQ